jgi:hypothetical protein
MGNLFMSVSASVVIGTVILIALYLLIKFVAGNSRASNIFLSTMLGFIFGGLFSLFVSMAMSIFFSAKPEEVLPINAVVWAIIGVVAANVFLKDKLDKE